MALLAALTLAALLLFLASGCGSAASQASDEAGASTATVPALDSCKFPEQPDGAVTYLNAIYGLETPLGIALDGQGDVFIGEADKAAIDVYGSDGKFKSTLNQHDSAGRPLPADNIYNIAMDEAGNRVYVASGGNTNAVHVLDLSGMLLFDMAPGAGDMAAGIKFVPFGVAVVSNREYVTARDGVYIFDDQGKFVVHWGTHGAGKGQFNFPFGIAGDRQSGDIYVADSLNRRIVALAPDGRIRWMLGAPDPDPQNGKTRISPFNLPRGVTVGPDGLVYVSDTFDQHVVVLDQRGNLIATIGSQGNGYLEVNHPEGLAISCGGLLHLVDRTNGRVLLWQLPASWTPPDPAVAGKFAAALIKGEAY